MQRISFLISNNFSFDQRMQKICSSLAQSEYEVTVHYPLRKNESGFQHSLAAPFKMFFSKGLGFYLELNHHLFWRNIFRPMSCISCVDLDTLPAAVLLKLFKRKPLILDCHEWFEETPEVYDRKWIYRFWKYLGKWLVPAADRCYTVNRMIANEMERVYRKPFEVVHNYPERKMRPDIQYSKSKIIIYQGVLNKDRGLEELILAMKHLDKYTCWLIGDGDIKAQLEQLVKSEKLQERIIFMGKLVPEKLWNITPQGWLGINLLTGDSKSYYYSLANKFFDYMMAEIPSLNIDYPVYREYIDQYEIGLLIKECISDEIVAAVQVLDQDQNLYERLCNNTRIASKDFVWSNESNKLISLYKDVI